MVIWEIGEIVHKVIKIKTKKNMEKEKGGKEKGEWNPELGVVLNESEGIKLLA